MRPSWCAVLLLAVPPGGQLVMDEIEVGASCSYFGENIDTAVTTFASDDEAAGVVQDVVASQGLASNFDVRAAGVPNAAAVIRGTSRYILYNQYFVREMREKTHNKWAAISIMAHEVAHHLNGHTLLTEGSRPKRELEADFFSGFVLQRMGAKLDDARVALDTLGSSRASATHPAKADRLAAITNGWVKSCNSDPKCKEPTEPSPTPEPAATFRELEKRVKTKSGGDSCEYAKDGVCDEPDSCEEGTDTTDCLNAVATPVPTNTQLYCCDGFGVRRCAIVLGAGPVGSACFCLGQGAGITCR